MQELEANGRVFTLSRYIHFNRGVAKATRPHRPFRGRQVELPVSEEQIRLEAAEDD